MSIVAGDKHDTPPTTGVNLDAIATTALGAAMWAKTGPEKSKVRHFHKSHQEKGKVESSWRQLSHG